jgi:hypothetical protein
MFRVRDAVKFGANRVCPMCNSGIARSSAIFDFGRPFESAGVQAPGRPLRRCLRQFNEETK